MRLSGSDAELLVLVLDFGGRVVLLAPCWPGHGAELLEDLHDGHILAVHDLELAIGSFNFEFEFVFKPLHSNGQ